MITFIQILRLNKNFQSDISALSSGTTHFFRTFAVNAQGDTIPDTHSLVRQIVDQCGCPASSFQVFFAGFSFHRMYHSWPKASPRDLSNGV